MASGAPAAQPPAAPDAEWLNGSRSMSPLLGGLQLLQPLLEVEQLDGLAEALHELREFGGLRRGQLSSGDRIHKSRGRLHRIGGRLQRREREGNVPVLSRRQDAIQAQAQRT